MYFSGADYPGGAGQLVCDIYNCAGVKTSYRPQVLASWEGSCQYTDDSDFPTAPSPFILTKNFNKTQTQCGSIIQTSNQVVGESIPLTGLPFNITHFSSRVVGRNGDYKLVIPLSGAKISSNVSGFTVEIRDQNNHLIGSQNLAAEANQAFTYEWSGIDNGVETWASTPRKFVIKTQTRTSAIADKIFEADIGSLKAKKLGLGGWLPSIWSYYDIAAEKVYYGDGNAREVKSVKDGLYHRIANESGSEVHYYDETGKVAFIRTGLTGSLLYTFGYDQATQKLITITDSFNRVTKFKYDDSGKLNSILSPEGIKTTIVLDENGYLKSIANPKNEVYQMTYLDGGLLNTFIKPSGNMTTLAYDENGNLVKDSNSAGHSISLVKTDTGIKSITAMGRTKENIYDAANDTEVEISPS